MESQAFNIARATWSQKLVTCHFIDVGMLSQAVHEALPTSARQDHSAQKISAMLTNDWAINPALAGGWYRTDGDREFVGVHTFVRRYSRWMKSLGAALGFNTAAMLIEDDWVTESSPELQAVFYGLMDRVRADLAEARAITDARIIGEAFQAARQSVAKGEHPNQTHIRTSYITRGLRRVS